jgi:FtsH-binding integral membrane protein
MAFGPERRTVSRAEAQVADIDVGLRKYMLGVYNYMALGVAFTGIVALLVASSPAALEAIFNSPIKWFIFGGILLSGFVAPRIMTAGSVFACHAMYWVYAGLWGALIAPYLIVYTGESLARVFFITAAAFAGMSLWGYTTKRDLAPMGAFLAMSTIGILIALVVNIFFFQDPGFQLLLSIVVVLVFAGLTAYETQVIRNFYNESDAADVQTRKSIFGAYMLYGSFVTMFVWLMTIFGVARE